MNWNIITLILTILDNVLHVILNKLDQVEQS